MAIRAINNDNDREGLDGHFGLISICEEQIRLAELPEQMKDSLDSRLTNAQYKDEVLEIMSEIREVQPKSLEQQFDQKVK